MKDDESWVPLPGDLIVQMQILQKSKTAFWMVKIPGACLLQKEQINAALISQGYDNNSTVKTPVQCPEFNRC